MTFKKRKILLATLSLSAVAILVGSIVWQSRPLSRLSDAPQKFTDVAYCNTTNPQQALSIYLPKRNTSVLSPVIVFIHGGGWKYGDKNGKIYDFYGTKLLNRGVAVVSIDYRLIGDNLYPEQNKDVACALSFLQDKRSEYRLATDKMVFFGDSAGGQLAAFAALKIPFMQYDYPAPIGVIDFYGVSDFTKIVNTVQPDLFARRYLGSRYNSLSATASPTGLVTKKAPPFLLVHGTADKTVPFGQSKELYDILTRNGVDAELISVQGADHAFTGPELPPAQAARVIDAFNVFTKELYGR